VRTARPHQPGLASTLYAIRLALLSLVASLFGLSETQALVVLFVLVPFVVAGIVVPLLVWRLSRGPKPVLTSDILAYGDPGEAEIISVRNVGGLFDPRPMVRFRLRVTAGSGEAPFDLEVVQSLPRAAISQFRPGGTVEVRLTPDRSAGAVVWGRWRT
jgi:hypothetical protein